MSKIIYDNSNIAESYAGLTTPLTFSFILHVYEGVYQHFCSFMGVSQKDIKLQKVMFASMVEFIGFRVYYNLSNWYKMLTFFPGYKFSSRFMEKMMGVEEKYQSQTDETVGFFEKHLIRLPKALFSSLKIMISFSFLGFGMRRFNTYFDTTFSSISSVDLSKLKLEELKDLYHSLDEKLVAQWKFPIANDFAVMISTGLVDMFFQKWLNSKESYSHLYVKNKGQLATLDPSRKIYCITNAIRNNSSMYELFKHEYSEEKVFQLLKENHAKSEVFQLIESYIKEFSCRIPNELKLESLTLEENPSDLIKLIRTFLKQNKANIDERTRFDESICLKGLSFGKRFFMRWILKWSSRSILRREESRFKRTLIFGFARKIFLAIGDILATRGVLRARRDIFYLKLEEIFSFEHKKHHSFFELVDARKMEQAKWNDIELPRRIESEESIGIIEQTFKLQYISKETVSADLVLKGRTASRPIDNPIVSGESLTLKEFDPSADFRDKILVTKQTDPGWTVVFPLLRGLIVERGGMLSHAAIVARELNIPCIVGVENATDRIKDGIQIRMDLRMGIISSAVYE